MNRDELKKAADVYADEAMLAATPTAKGLQALGASMTMQLRIAFKQGAEYGHAKGYMEGVEAAVEVADSYNPDIDDFDPYQAGGTIRSALEALLDQKESGNDSG